MLIFIVQLKRLCSELEAVAAPQHSGKVRALLERERGLQAKISQITGSRSQQQGASSQARALLLFEP